MASPFTCCTHTFFSAFLHYNSEPEIGTWYVVLEIVFQAPPPLLTLHFNKISQKDVFSYTQRSLRSSTVNTSVMSTKVSFPVLLIKNKTEFGEIAQAVVERAWVHIPACTENSGMTTSICNFSAREIETGRSLGLWPVSLIEPGSSRHGL